MYNLNHKKYLNGKLVEETNLKFMNLFSAQSRKHWDLVLLQEELLATPEETRLSAYIHADNDFNQEECHEFMITEM